MLEIGSPKLQFRVLTPFASLIIACAQFQNSDHVEDVAVMAETFSTSVPKKETNQQPCNCASAFTLTLVADRVNVLCNVRFCHLMLLR